MYEPLRVCLEREIELGPLRLRLLDWPGLGGPLLHVTDPLAPDRALIDTLAATLAPRTRVVSLEAASNAAYQTLAHNVASAVRQFGWERPVLLGQGAGCVIVLIAAAWHAAAAGALLLDPAFVAAEGKPGLFARSLRECPPDYSRLVASLDCPVRVLRSGGGDSLPGIPEHDYSIDAVERFLQEL